MQQSCFRAARRKSEPPAVHVFAAACLAESHLIPLNPGESRLENVFRARRRPSPQGEMGGCAQPRNGAMLVLNRVEPAPIEARRYGTTRRDHEVSTGMSRRSGGTHAGGMRRPSDRHVGCGYSRPAAANTASRAPGADRAAPDDYSCRRRCRGTGRRAAAGRPSRRDQGFPRLGAGWHRRRRSDCLPASGRRLTPEPGRGRRHERRSDSGRPAPALRPRAADGTRGGRHPTGADRRDGPRGSGDQRGSAHRLAAGGQPRPCACRHRHPFRGRNPRRIRAGGGLASRGRAANRREHRAGGTALYDRADRGPERAVQDRDRRRPGLRGPYPDRGARAAGRHRARAHSPARQKPRGSDSLPENDHGRGRQRGAFAAHSSPARSRGPPRGVWPS